MKWTLTRVCTAVRISRNYLINNMAFRYVQKRSFGFCGTNRVKVPPAIPASFVESFQCHNTDEYPIVGIEDDTLVPPLACSFCNVRNLGHFLALVDENGYLVLYNTNKTGDEATVKYWRAHNNAVFDLAWMEKEDKLLTASGDQTVVLWDVKAQQNLETFKGHTSSVRSVSFRKQDDAVFASGSRDGHIRIWDRRCNRKENKVSSVNTMKNAHALQQQALLKRRKSRQGLAPPQDSQQSVTCVTFQSDNLLVSSGAVDGCVKVWDMRKNYSLGTAESVPLYKFSYPGPSKRSHGFTSLTFDSSLTRLFASCTDDIIYMYNMTSYNPLPVRFYRGHKNSSFYVKATLSPDDNFLLSGSCDENAYIWKVDSPNQSPVVLKGHRSEVSDVAWCSSDPFKIVTLSDDNSMRIWRHNPAKLFQTSHDPSITGTAERTHRDIGVSVQSVASPKTPKASLSAQSPAMRLKRLGSQTPTVSPVTPKRARLGTSSPSTVSPSIKLWLKRAASDSPVSSQSKCLKLMSSVSSPARLSDNSRLTSSTEKKETSVMPVRQSCKRKLVSDENDEENPRKKQNAHKSPVKCESLKENVENDCESGGIRHSDKSSASDLRTESPRNRESVLRNLDSDVNASPSKNVSDLDRSASVFTPVRPKKLDLDATSNFSPTCNLPNLVIDGPQSPCSQETMDSKSENKKPKVDWLTEMRLRKIASDKSVPEVCDKLKTENSTSGQSPLLRSPIPGVPSIRSFFKKKSIQ